MNVKASSSSSFQTDYDHPLNLSIAFSLPDAAAGALDLGFGILTFRTFSLFLSEAKIVEKHLLDVVEDVDDDEEEDDEERHPPWHHLGNH